MTLNFGDVQYVVGAAGRKWKDEIGETYLCCETQDVQAVVELFEDRNASYLL